MQNLQPYHYHPIDSKTIRLLRLNVIADQISCNIVEYSLTNPPSYSALSYAWGIQDFSASIECDAQRLDVTPDLLSVLQVLSRRPDHALLWIDAICINQKDESEKSAQVRAMTTIYSSAREVLIWLGDGVDDSHLAMDGIPLLNATLSTVSDLAEVDRHSLTDFGLPQFTDPFWPALTRLFFRKWFTRVWVMQEVLLSKHAIVLCGDRSMDWQDFVQCANHYRLIRLVDEVLEHYKIPHNTPELPDHGLSMVPIVQIMRDRMADGQESIDVKTLLSMARRKLSKEPIDRIYGILALFPVQIRDRIIVDYSELNRREYWKTYIHAFRVLLENIGVGALDLTPSQKRHPSLPSWCPDFSSDSSQNSLGKNYSAGMLGTAVQHAAQIPPILLGRVETEIELNGLAMDTVLDVHDLAWRKIGSAPYRVDSALAVVQCESACSRLSRQIYRTAEKVPLQHMTTLVAGMFLDRSPYPTDLLQRDYQNAMAGFRRAVGLSEGLQDIPTGPKAISAETYRGAMNVTWRYSKFFTTVQGRIGIGPDTLLPGDSVCILFTANAPIVLRPKQNGPTHEFLGSAYVHGLMDGEAFAARNPVEMYDTFRVE